MIPVLHIQLLGAFRLLDSAGASILSVTTPRLQSLLAYLALHRDCPQSRQHLAFLLWPDSSEEQARTNLRKQLVHLRRALPDADSLLQFDAQTIRWQPQATVVVDVEQFEQALAQSTAADPQAVESLQKAVDLYGGDLLPGCYDDWVIPRREQLRTRQIEALERVVVLLEEQRAYRSAIHYANRLLQLDPLHEPACLHLMRLYPLQGNRAAALQTYHLLVERLAHELDVEPGADVRAAYDRLLRGEPAAVAVGAPPVDSGEQPPFVGRETAWLSLQTAWREVGQKPIRFVLVSGEPGIGKTRLVEELLQWTARQQFCSARARCYVAEGQLAFAPLVEWLRSDPIRTRLDSLDEVWLVELARLLPDLLVERPNLPRPQPVTDSWQRRHLFEALALAVLAADSPLLLVIDDLQWCDQETLEWLHFFLRFDTRSRVLVVATARSSEVGERRALTSFLFSLRSNGQFNEINLGPLSSDETAQLAAHMAHRQLTQEQIKQLYQNTEGNPLFVVESVRVANWSQAREGDEAPPAPIEPSALPALPPKVFSVIEARLAQLSPPARELVGLAATVGREFSATVLVHASTHSEHEVVEALDELWRRQIVREHGPDRYDFSHDRIREAAYAGLSSARRRLFHRSVAQSLEVVNAGDLDRMAGQVAAHYEQAGLPEQAIPYYRRAAEAAMHVYAYGEAISLFQCGLSLLTKLPASRAKAELELSFRLGLALPLVVVGGYGSSQVWESCIEAQRLLRELGYPENPVIARALAIWYIAHRNYQKAIEQGELLLALALQAGTPPDPVLDAEGHYVLGAAAFWQGRFTAARDHLEKVCAEYDVRRHEVHIAQFVQDVGVVCCVRLAYALWFLGYVDQAQDLRTKALSQAQQWRHPYTTAYALGVASWIADKCGDAERTEQFTDQLLDLCGDYQMDYWLPIGMALKGMALVNRGEDATGLERIHAGIDMTRSHGQDINRPYMLTKLAQAHARAGRMEQALAALDEALTSVAHHGDHWYEAELYRLKGELLWANGAPTSVVAALFGQALDLARRQQAKSLELRAATSLARLWASQGRRAKAHALLAEVVAWFTEGFSAADYQEAQDLLTELA